MATTVAPAAPTLAEADRAAAALIAGGVEEVLLFGSVASGAATPASDIDLVAIYADLDYSQRASRRQALEAAAAAAAAPWPVQVHVTDRPEWRARIDNVPTSLERRIHASAVAVAAATERAPVNWNKEMVLPMSDAHEALRQFDHWVLPRLSELEAATHRGTQEVDPALAPPVAERARLERMVRICTTAAITAETTLKALAVLHGRPTPSEKELRRAGHLAAPVQPGDERSRTATRSAQWPPDVRAQPGSVDAGRNARRGTRTASPDSRPGMTSGFWRPTSV